MTTESVEVRRGLPEGAAARVAELYWEAFAGKLGLALGPRRPAGGSSPGTCTRTGP